MEYYLAINQNGILIHCYKLDESQKHGAEWKKPVTKGHILIVWSHLKEIGKAIEMESISDCLGKGVGTKGFFGGWWESSKIGIW